MFYPTTILQLYEAFLIRFSTLLHMRSLVQNGIHTENVRITIQQFSLHISKENRKRKNVFIYKKRFWSAWKLYKNKAFFSQVDLSKNMYKWSLFKSRKYLLAQHTLRTFKSKLKSSIALSQGICTAVLQQTKKEQKIFNWSKIRTGDRKECKRKISACQAKSSTGHFKDSRGRQEERDTLWPN